MSPNPGTPPHAEFPRPAGVAAPARGGDSRLSFPAWGVRADLPPPSGRVLTSEEFGIRFEESWRVLWCAAVAVVRDRNLAQDIVQQSAVVALERLDDFDAQTSFVSWMVRIVKNLALNEARKTTRRKTAATDSTVIDGSAVAAAGPAPVVLTGRGGLQADQAAFDDDVLHALDELEETARGCLLLKVILDLPYREIALALDIPEGTAASHVHRSRKLMRDQLRDRFIARPHPSAAGFAGDP